MQFMVESGAIDWDKVMQVYESSGLPQRSFCKEHDLSFSQFKYHRYQISLKRKSSSQQVPKPNFAPVILSSPMPHQEKEMATLSLPNGIRCELPIGCSREDMLSLLKVLYTCG